MKTLALITLLLFGAMVLKLIIKSRIKNKEKQ